MPTPSFRRTCTSGARQFVVQEAFETMWCLAGSYSPSFTPISNVFTSPLPGAEMMTFFAPAARWPLAFSKSVKSPVDSMTYSTPSAFHGSWLGSLVARMHFTSSPPTTSTSLPSAWGLLFFVASECLKRPWTESYFIWYAK